MNSTVGHVLKLQTILKKEIPEWLLVRQQSLDFQSHAILARNVLDASEYPALGYVVVEYCTREIYLDLTTPSILL